MRIGAHALLNILGIVNPAADLLNAAMYLSEGDTDGALNCLMGLLPVDKALGWVSGGAKKIGNYIRNSGGADLVNGLMHKAPKVFNSGVGKKVTDTFKGIPFEEGGGFKVNWGGDRILQYHPANLSHHGGEYFKISSGETGTIRIDLDGNLIN